MKSNEKYSSKSNEKYCLKFNLKYDLVRNNSWLTYHLKSNGKFFWKSNEKYFFLQNLMRNTFQNLWRWRREADSWLTYSTRSTSSEGKGSFFMDRMDEINENGWYSPRSTSSEGKGIFWRKWIKIYNIITHGLPSFRRYLVQTRAQYEYVYRCCQAFLEGRLESSSSWSS